MCKNPNLMVASDGRHTTCPNCYWEGELFNPEYTPSTDPLEQAFHGAPAEHPLGDHTGSSNEPHLEDDNWLVQEMVKEGGAKMTPFEQRDFIDEEGVARNSDKLDLMGTHYEAAEMADQFLFGL